MKNIPSVILACAALLSAAQAAPMTGSFEHRPLYSSHDRLWHRVQKPSTENQKLSFNMPTHPPRVLVFNMPTHPPRVLVFNMPTHPPRLMAFNMPTHPPARIG
jgi:hypothetical protein